MTRPEDTDAADKATWAGADTEAEQAAEAVEAEVVDDATATPQADEVQADDATTELQAKVDELTADLQRVSAEFANYRKRIERERQATIDTSKGSVLAELLPIVDDLDRAREHGHLDEGPLKLFADKIHSVLSVQGVETFGEEGDAFDPAVHEAVQDESEGSEPVLGTVLRKGYRHGERTLRTAMVVVR